MEIWRATVAALIAGTFLGALPAHAGPTQIAVQAAAKKEDGEKRTKGNVTHEEKLAQYTVKLTNKSFAPASGLTAQYRIFIRDDSGKGAVSQQKLKRQAFSATIPDMANNGTYSFDTESVKLQSSMLQGGYYYLNGNRNQSSDRLAGVWIRILQGDKIVGEYINPSTLAAKEKF